MLHLHFQKNYQQSLDDSIYVSICNRFNGEAPAFDDAKLESLAKSVALQKAPQLVRQIKEQAESGNGKLPSQAHCKNFFDSFPAVQLWRESFEQVPKQLRSDLVDRCKAAATAAERRELVAASLKLVCYDLFVENNYKEGFRRLNELQPLRELVESVKAAGEECPADHLVALQLELLGTERFLLYDLPAAKETLELSLVLGKRWIAQQNQIDEKGEGEEGEEEEDGIIFSVVDVEFKLAALFLEDCQEEKALAVYDRLLRDKAIGAFKPWVLVHRVAYWLNRRVDDGF